MNDLPSLFPHQEDLRDRTRAALAKHRRVILTAPPGVGKTRMAKWILGATALREPAENQSGHSLFAVHRRGLVDNASSSMAEEPRLRHGVIMSGVKAAYGARVQVASIDSLLSWFVEGGQYDTSITFDLIVYDECISGDSIVDTDLGSMRIDQIPKLSPSAVKTYSPDRGVHFASILRWFPKGCRDTLTIHTHAGNIRCTPDHEIYTRRGWLQAQFVSPTDEILVCAAAGRFRDPDACSGGGTGIASPESSSPPSGKNCAVPPRPVAADAGRSQGRRSSAWRHGSRASVSRFTTSTPTVTSNATATKACSSRRSNGRRSSARCSATRPSDIRTPTPSRRVSTARTGAFRRNGQITRRGSCTALTPRHASLTTVDGDTSRSSRLRRAIRHSSRSTTWLFRMGRSVFHGRGSMPSGTSVLRGGSATTVQLDLAACSSTQRDTPSTRTRSSRTGSATTSERPRSAAIKQRTPTSSISPVGRRLRSATGSRPTSRTACGTSWSRVTKIVPAKPVDVFDIEVEGSHCFFANNLLVHNCHSHHPKLSKFLQHHDAYRKEIGKHPAYVIGLTATPEAKGLSDIYRNLVLGPPTQWLIDNGFLAPFRYFRATQGRLGLLIRKGGEFTPDSVEKAMSGLSGALVRDWKRFADGRPTVGFFPRRQHAQEAREALEEAGLRVAYVDGTTDDDTRKRLFWELNQHRIDYLCNVQVVERGTDIPSISCVQLCVAIGSLSRYRQMIGRGSRPHPSKQDCLILDHGGNVLRHGFFEDDPLWSLDRSSSGVGEVKVRPTIECPKCQAIYRGGRCRSCGYEPTQQERKGQGLEFDGAELREVTKREKAPVRVKSAEELMLMSLYAAGRSGRTWKQAVGMFLGMAKKQGTKYRVPKRVTVGGHAYWMLPFGHAESGRRVGELFPWTVGRGNHGGRFLEESNADSSR